MVDPRKTDESLFDGRTLNYNNRAPLRAYRRLSLRNTRDGIPDRVVLMEDLREELERRSGSLRSCSLLFIHIREVTLRNDTYGFPTDGHIIDAVARKLRQGLRAADLLIRSGDYGFAVFLAKASPAGANAAATRLQAAIGNTDFYYESVAFQVKIAVTVTSVRGEDTVETILDQAEPLLHERERSEDTLQEQGLMNFDNRTW
jgi:diguanylate cyclase (GGDEF)-like protein